MLAAIVAELLVGMVVQRGYLMAVLAGYVSAENESMPSVLVMVSKLVSTALVVTWALRRWGNEKWGALGYAGFRPAVLPLAFLPIILAVPIFISEVDNLLRALDSANGLDDWQFAPDLGELIGNSWMGVALAVIIGPLVEEIVFRGVILRGLLGRWPQWAAITVSAAMFTVMHFNPAQAPVALLLGMILGWVYARTRSLGLVFVAHALNNLSAFVPILPPFEVYNYHTVPPEGVDVGFFHPWWFDGLGIALTGLGLWVIHRLAPPAESWRVAARVETVAGDEPPVLEPPMLAGKMDGNGHCQPSTLVNTRPSMSSELDQLVTSLAQRARAASLVLATAPTLKKDSALHELARMIENSQGDLLSANAHDLASPEAAALTPASRDRLTLTPARLAHLAQSVREVAALPDPVGTVLEETTRPNGLKIRKLRVPIGVIGIIYESRPNVTVDCAILCLKSGNASILRGGKECFHTNTALALLIRRALVNAGLPADAVQLVPTTDRAALTTLLKLDTLIHCIIPRGGENLIRYVAQNSTIPVIKHYKGVCFVYVDAAADLAMAEAITLNAKVQRPSACNAAEQLLVHRDVAEKFLPAVARALRVSNVELRCDAASAEILARDAILNTPAQPADYTAEFLDYVIAVRIVDSLDTAIATINRDSSNHSDAIVTADETAARRFLAEIDSATVYWNASTRFTDGFEFGYGAEIGISTDRLHARGPMGLPELCSYKFVIEGNGQVRG